MTASEFEENGRRCLEKLLGTKLGNKEIPPTKTWDYVSEDESIVGDAKLLTYKGSASPEKSIISEHVWLLEKIPARLKVLLFEGNGFTPMDWLRRWRMLLPDNFWFLYLEGDQLSVLFGPDEKLTQTWKSLVDDRGKWQP